MKVRILDTSAVLLGKATASGREEATQASEELAWRVEGSKRSVPWGRSRESWRRRVSFSAAIGQLSVHFSVRLAFDEVLATIPMGFTST